MSPSAEWHSRLGPLDFSVVIRHFELRGGVPERPRPFPAAGGELPRPAPAPGGRVRAREDDVLDWESEGGATA